MVFGVILHIYTSWITSPLILFIVFLSHCSAHSLLSYECIVLNSYILVIVLTDYILQGNFCLSISIHVFVE